jgi:penicillin amidase
VAEISPRELTRDIGTRLHKFRGNLDAELNHYHPRGKSIVEAYVRGVNAWVDEAMRTPAALPIEFRMLGITPGKWTPEVVIRAPCAHLEWRTNHMRRPRPSEPPPLTGWLQGGDPPLTLDPLIDPKTFPADVLKTYTAFRDTIDFRPDDIVPAWRGQARAAALLDAAGDDAATLLASGDGLSRIVDTGIGSNNWIVSGAKTQSSMPIMANDPHRVIEAPSLRYWHISSRRAGTSSAAASRCCPASRSATTNTARGASRSSAPTRKISTSTRPTRPTRTNTATRAAGRRCASSRNRFR